MFEYVIELVIPRLDASNIEEVSEDSYITMELATYNFNPGLHLDDIVWLKDYFGTHGDKPSNFETKVVGSRKEIISGNNSKSKKDTFRIVMTLEVIEKDNLAIIKERLIKLNSNPAS